MEELMPSRRVIAGLAAVVVGAVLWYVLLFRDQQAELVRLDGEIAALEGQVAEWVEATKRLSDYHEEYTALQETHHQLLSQIPVSGRVYGLAEEIIAMARERGCRVGYVGIPFSRLFAGGGGGGVVVRGLDVVPIRLVVEGDFLSVGRFMESLASLPFFAAFGDLEIDRSSDGVDRVEADFHVNIFVREESRTGREGA
jgi:Tfp pilus assembly protein PilO